MTYRNRLRKMLGVIVLVSVSLLSPADALATDSVGNPTGAPENTGAPACTGAGCGQGADQGTDQGSDQGGPSLEELGVTTDEEGNTVLPDDFVDTRQGATQGTAQGSGNGVAGENANTGAGSENANNVDADSTTDTSIDNDVTQNLDADAKANTGGNAQNANTGAGGTATGDANIGVTQVVNDNTATIGGSSGLNVTGHDGSYDGDLTIGFGDQDGQLTGQNGGSVRAINDTTGSDSSNTVEIDTRTEEINEVQNDGLINNLLNLEAITGQNEANRNTGDGSIETGDANIAATLVNLLNTTVINGDLWVSVADIFGDLNGNIILPDFATLAASVGAEQMDINAVNDNTGSDSENDIDIDVTDTEVTDIYNDAEVITNVDAEAITGQNVANKNTGGGVIDTGDGSVSASNLTLANTTVEGGNWGLVVVNALNRWLGFMVGDSGEVRALSQDETIREIEARNSDTGSSSENEIDIDLASERETTVENDAVINNDVKASAITGQNEASKNTGRGEIATGDANVGVTAVNIANTTVKDASLFIAVVNVFGDWMGDLFYDDTSLLAAAGSGYGDSQVTITAENTDTGSESENNIDVDVDRSQETNVENDAEVTTTLNANIDTGNNRTNRNTTGAGIHTGDGFLGLHSRTVANLVGVGVDPVLELTVNGLNDTTGFDSRNRIRARLNDERVVSINNDANISTIFAGLANTGYNEASYNTIGGDIVTGDIDADVGISNLVNRVMLALADRNSLAFAAGEEIVIDAELINRLTGALSENTNDVEANYDLLTDIINNGLIKNLIDLIFNTGGNTSGHNTVAGNVYSGAGCVSGDVHNSLNSIAAGGVGGSASVNNDGLINNLFGALVETGNNLMANNTDTIGGAGAVGTCGKLAHGPDNPDEEEPAGPMLDEGLDGDDGDDGGGQGGGEVAGTVDEKRDERDPSKPAMARHSVLKRFPVAGDIGSALWVQGKDGSRMWALFVVLSVLFLGMTWHLDRRRQAIIS